MDELIARVLTGFVFLALGVYAWQNPARLLASYRNSSLRWTNVLARAMDGPRGPAIVRAFAVFWIVGGLSLHGTVVRCVLLDQCVGAATTNAAQALDPSQVDCAREDRAFWDDIERDAAADDPGAIYTLAVDADSVERRGALLARATALRYPPAMQYTAMMIHQDGLSSRYAEAKQLLVDAALMGDLPAAVDLTDCISDGTCRVRDAREAYYWLVYAHALLELPHEEGVVSYELPRLVRPATLEPNEAAEVERAARQRLPAKVWAIPSSTSMTTTTTH